MYPGNQARGDNRELDGKKLLTDDAALGGVGHRGAAADLVATARVL